ncbi:MAG: 5-(carboxyamino)imidazole ribonucleotide synthase [Oligoflexales bacterium]
MRTAEKIGIIGGGQLGFMLAQSGLYLGMQTYFLDPNEASPSGLLANGIFGKFDDTLALEKLAQSSEILTYEFENIDHQALLQLDGKVHPSPKLLQKSQDRLAEKQLCNDLGFETAGFLPIDSSSDLEQVAKKLGFPFLVKTRRFGYDGKGQVWIRSADDFMKLKMKPGVFIAEEKIDFDKELSIAASRGHNGEICYYPLSQNWHSEGILRESCPYICEQDEDSNREKFQKNAESIVRSFMEKFDYVGVLSIEFFLHRDKLLINELAPRVHNSFHWTLTGSETSQFENHMRAVAGLPLGSCKLSKPVRLFNCIGTMPSAADCLKVEGLHYYSYHKSPRKGRKMGHLILSHPQEESIDAVRKLLS